MNKTTSQFARMGIAISSMVFLSLLSARGADTTWDNSKTGTQSWTTPANWDNGVPTSSDNAIFTGSITACATIQNAMGSFRDLNIDASIDAGKTLVVTWADGAEGRAVNILAQDGTGGVILRAQSGMNSLSLTDSLVMTGANKTITFEPVSATITAPGGFYFGMNGTGRSETFVLGNAELIGDVTLYKGAYWWEPNDTATSFTFTVDGDVTMTVGDFTGAAPGMRVGRGKEHATRPVWKITGDLTLESGSGGYIQLLKGRVLEAQNAKFESGTQLDFQGWGVATQDGTIRTLGDLVIAGGWVNTNVAGSGGAFVMDVGGDFVVETGSRFVLGAPGTLGQTTLQLQGDLDFVGTGLTGNLNNLLVSLEGSGIQHLEAAVTAGNSTFTINTLTFADGGYYKLVDNHLNIAAGEFFKTGALVNLGEATLDLNGLQFFVGGAELTLGDYTTFGGTVLHVIPEPATGVFVVMIFGLSVAFQRRRRRKRSPSPGVPPSSAPFIGLARGSGMLHDTVFENRMIAVQP